MEQVSLVSFAKAVELSTTEKQKQDISVSGGGLGLVIFFFGGGMFGWFWWGFFFYYLSECKISSILTSDRL